MKRILLLLFTLVTMAGYAQYPITSISINLPANPPANTADWAAAMPPVMITAQAQLRNGKVPPEVIECKILVTIKQGGSKKYGMYTNTTAPQSGFSSAVKNWTGANAISLLGKDETLPPGTYEFCVQFFGINTPVQPLSNEVCKTFTIADNKPDTKPVTNINITMSPTPPANTADWATSIPPVMITAQTKLINGQVPGNVQESKILVTIKQGGSKKYGVYTAGTAPASGFTSPVKNWSGANATALLGQDYTLQPGNYELCVQLFWQGPAGMVAISDEKCKPFTIQNTKDQNYTPPVNLTPADKKIFTENEIKAQITFRWTPLLPRPKDPVIYRLKVWQLMQGQNGTQAMRTNPPIVTKDVDNITQANIANLNAEPCMLPRLCAFIWNVEAVDAQGKVLGSSEATGFNVGDNTATVPINQYPANSAVLTEKESKAPLTFRWTPLLPRPRDPVIYKLRVWQIKEGQKGPQAMKANRPVVEKEVKDASQFVKQNLMGDIEMVGGSANLIWNVQAVNEKGEVLGSSEPTAFKISSTNTVASASCAMDPSIVDISCISSNANTKTIRVKIKISNNSAPLSSPATLYLNHPNTFTHPLYASFSLNASNLIQSKNLSFINTPGVNSVVAAVPLVYPVTIPYAPSASSSIIQEVDVNINNSVTSFPLLIFTTSQGINPGDALIPCYDTVWIKTLPQCPCTYCNDDMIQLSGQNQITDANNILTINNTISIPGIQVKQFKAELIGIIYKPQSGNEQCWVCNKDDNQWGNFTSGTFTSPFPSMINGVFPSLPCCGGNSHHTIGWWGAPTIINNQALKLNISLPPASTLSCCPYDVEFCIRYTFTDIECRSCSVVRCFKYTRNPQGGHLDDGQLPNDTPNTQRYFKQQ